MLSATPPLPPAFAQELARLNERQRQAVTHPDGPLLVVAGPGTGKTQLLAARVAWLLLQPDARPQEVLCLTYTDAAARNMRQRLLRFIGPAAHRVAIHTFHSLGQLIIQENAELLGRHDLEAASDLEADEILRELLDQLPAGHLLRRPTGDLYYDLPHLKRLFQTMKREGWTAPDLLAALDDYRQSLPDDPAFQYKNPPAPLRAQGVQPGDAIPHKVAAELARLDRTAAAVPLLATYQVALSTRRRFDYDDMLAWATRLLSEHENLRLSYQERFQHFLVDEYQDTNGAQSQLLYLLAGYWEAPSLLVVGDDDQSIFRFQGASVANVLDFRQRYPQAAAVVLEENYRSSGTVLAVAQDLIARNQERLTQQLGLNKELHARHLQFAHSTQQPRLRRYASPLHEAADVAAELAALHRAGQWPAGRVGVIARNHDQLDRLAGLLRAAGVPFQRRRPVNALAEPLADQLRRVLRYLALAVRLDEPPAAEAALFELLHLDCLAVPSADLALLAATHLHYRRATPAAGPPALPWHAWAVAAVHPDAASAPAGLPMLSVAGRAALAAALALLDGWVQAAVSLPLPALLELLLLETLLPAQLVAAPQPEHLLAVARTLLGWGRAEARRQPGAGVPDLLRVWDVLAATRTGLPLEQTSGTDEAALELLTAHGAKGLEWERVWLLGCQQNTWRRRAADRGFRLPPALAPPVSDEADGEEARRLFFVALTRAQEHLTVSWSGQDDAGQELEPCEFVAELAQDGLPVQDVAVPPALLAAARRAELAPAPPPAPVPDPALLDELLADFTLSPTVLNAYLACPVACYYEHLLQVPAPRNERLLFGTAAHRALEAFLRPTLPPTPAPESADELVALFGRYFARARFELPATMYQRLLRAGQQLLPAWWAHWQAPAGPVVVEYQVRAQLPDGPRLVGRLDRLDLHPDGRRATVLDYKTGNPASAASRDKLRPARPGAAAASLTAWHQDKTLRGGDHWRQGVCYHLLLLHDPDQRYQASSVAFDFLRPVTEPGKPPRYERRQLVVTPTDEAVVRAQLTAVDAAIRRHEFGHGCGECAWCRLQASAPTKS